jgi:hypothetical protein
MIPVRNSFMTLMFVQEAPRGQVNWRAVVARASCPRAHAKPYGQDLAFAGSFLLRQGFRRR